MVARQKTVRLSFPIKGIDSNWASSRQPPLTTPSCLNVRAYPSEEERARGGQRPGFMRLGASTFGGAGGSGKPVQYIGYMDWGFGDTVEYSDEFEYGAGLLKDNAKWSAADTDLTVLNGFVHCNTLPLTDQSSGEFQSFAGDTWDDFILAAGVQWTLGVTGDITFWVSSATGAANDGMTCKISYTSTWLAAPLLGFTSAIVVTLTSEGGGTTKTATWTRQFGALFSVLAYGVIIEAGKDKVRVLLDGQEVLSVVRPAPDTVCSAAGFKMSRANVSGSPLLDSMVDFRLANWRLSCSTRATSITRKAVAIHGGLVYSLGVGGSGTATPEDADVGDTAAAVSLISATPCNGSLFFVDGSQPRLYNPMGTTNKVMGWTARKGTIEKGCRLAANWRNRVVLAGAVEDPQNFYMSRQDDPYDWDYGKMDEGAAVAGGGGQLGRIGDPITALCPLSDDVMIFGCTKSIWALHGDPSAGGRMVLVTDQIGILGQNAWATDEQGNFYFLAPTGLYAMRPAGLPKALSSQRIPVLGELTPVQTGHTGAAGQTYVTLAYDAERDGLLVYQTGFSGGAATHYFYDLRNDAFWPETYHADGNPTCAAFWNSATAANRRLLAGTRKGQVFAYHAGHYDTGKTGARAAIPSYCYMGAFRFGGAMEEAVLTDMRLTFSAGSSGAYAKWYGSEAAHQVLTAVGIAGYTCAAGANRSRVRVRGTWHALRIGHSASGKTWSYEDGEATILTGGAAR